MIGANNIGRRDDLDVLLVEDDPDDRALVRELLADVALGETRAGRCRLYDTDTLASALAALDRLSFDVILLDLQLPDAMGLEALERLVARQGPAPILVLTGLRDEKAALAAVQAGAQDFLQKGQLGPDMLGRAIRYAIERHRLRREVALKARELEASEDRLRRLIASSADGMVITNADGTIIFANPAAEKLFDRPRSALLQTPLGLPVDGGAGEMELRRPDGRSLTAEMRVVAVEWQGSPAHLATFRDITAHKETLRQLEETRVRQLTMRDQFLSHVSHELRTPLTVAQQWVALLRDGLLGPLSPEQIKALETVLRNGRHLERLIEDLLEATRIHNGKLRVDPLRTRLPALAEEAVAAVRATQRAETVTYRLELPPSLPDLLADPGRVRQVLINLLGNAVKFTPAGGVVTLAAAQDAHEPEHLQISVSDTGCGIPPDEQEHIFEQLYQRDLGPEVGRRGLGLGLFICRQLVTSQGGRIWVDSEVGRGSTFHFTVPVFSCRALLSRLPAPVAGNTSLCLVCLDAHAVDSQPLQGFEAKYLDAVRRVASACLMPDRDLLLPRLVCDEFGELAFIVAGAEPAGADVLVERLRAELANAGDTGRSRLSFRFEVAPLAVPARTGRPDAAWLDVAAPVLEVQLERLTAAGGRSTRA